MLLEKYLDYSDYDELSREVDKLRFERPELFDLQSFGAAIDEITKAMDIIIERIGESFLPVQEAFEGLAESFSVFMN